MAPAKSQQPDFVAKAERFYRLSKLVQQIPEGPALELCERYLKALIMEHEGRVKGLVHDIETWMKECPGKPEKVLELMRAKWSKSEWLTEARG